MVDTEKRKKLHVVKKEVETPGGEQVCSPSSSKAAYQPYTNTINTERSSTATATSSGTREKKRTH